MANTVDNIIEHIKSMPETEAKSKFAELMINYYRIGHGGYTKEQCINDYESIYKEIVLRDMFRNIKSTQ